VVQAEIELVIYEVRFDLVNSLARRVMISLCVVPLERSENRVCIADIEGDKGKDMDTGLMCLERRTDCQCGLSISVQDVDKLVLLKRSNQTRSSLGIAG